MASSESEDNQILLKRLHSMKIPSMKTSRTIQYIILEAPQRIEAEFAKQYIKDRRKYEHMDKVDFGINKLIPQTSQPQRFGPLEASQQFEAEFAEQYTKNRH